MRSAYESRIVRAGRRHEKHASLWLRRVHIYLRTDRMREKLRYRISSITSTSVRAPLAEINALSLTRSTEYKRRVSRILLRYIGFALSYFQTLNYIYNQYLHTGLYLFNIYFINRGNDFNKY